MKIEIVDEIRTDAAFNYLQSTDTGAVNTFVGTVRNNSKGKEVVKLVFEAYPTMALKELRKIAAEAIEKWPIKKVVVEHVVGEKLPGEPVVLIGVTAAHRDASFDACRYIIDQLKARVPIWKKEFYIDNSIWVNAHP